MKIAPKILLVYSSLVSVFLVVSSFLSSRGSGLPVGAIVLTPVALYFVITLINASFKKNYDFGYKGTFLQVVMAILLLIVLVVVSLINITKII